MCSCTRAAVAGEGGGRGGEVDEGGGQGSRWVRATGQASTHAHVLMLQLPVRVVGEDNRAGERACSHAPAVVCK